MNKALEKKSKKPPWLSPTLPQAQNNGAEQLTLTPQKQPWILHEGSISAQGRNQKHPKPHPDDHVKYSLKQTSQDYS